MWVLDKRFQYSICFGMEEYTKYCKRNNLDMAKDISDNAMAVTVPYPGHMLCVVVYLQPIKKRLERDAIGTLVHEATHVLDNIFEYAGEKKPGHETRAYLMSQIVDSFLEAYLAFNSVSKT